MKRTRKNPENQNKKSQKTLINKNQNMKSLYIKNLKDPNLIKTPSQESFKISEVKELKNSENLVMKHFSYVILMHYYNKY